MQGGTRRQFGVWGETHACLFLQRQGFLIVERNFFTTQGEIDIVAKKGGDYYFIEVKARKSGELATDLAITSQKKYRLAKTIKTYCYRRNITEGSFIAAGLLVTVDKAKRRVLFRLAVDY